MARVTYIGGFGNGRTSAEKVGEALSNYYEDVDVFTFSDYINSPSVAHLAMHKVDLVTHSAGALALERMRSNPNIAYLLNPPLPRSIGALVGKTLVKTTRMFMPGKGVHSAGDIPPALHYMASSTAELVMHPTANLSNLNRISRFDAIGAAIYAKKNGLPVSLTWTNHDAYYQPSDADLDKATFNRIPVHILEGEHDEVALRPDALLNQILNQTA